MKSNILTLLALVTFSIAHAQLHDVNEPVSNNKHTLLHRVLNVQALRYAPIMRTTAVTQRLVAQANYFSPPFAARTDSVVFRYSGGRGSVFLPAFMSYLPLVSHRAVDPFDGGISGYDVFSGTPLLHNEAPVVKSDSSIYYKPSGAGTSVYDARGGEVHTFDAAGNLLESYNYSTSGGLIPYRDSMTYAADGNISTIFEYTAESTTTVSDMVPEFFATFTYGAAGRLLADEQYRYYSGVWYPYSTFTYSYDAAGNLVLAHQLDWNGTVFAPAYDYVLEYGTANRLVRYSIYDIRDTTTWLIIDDSMSYAPGTSYPTFLCEKDYAFGSLRFMDITIKNITTLGKPDTVRHIALGRDSLTVNGSSLTTLIYNSWANPVEEHIYADSYTATPVTETGRTFYYYETYDPAAVTDVHSYSVPGISLQPNPAGSSVTAVLSGTVSPGAVTVHIADMTGRVLSATNVVPVGNRVQLSVADLPAGCYLLSATQNGHVLGREKLIKQ